MHLGINVHAPCGRVLENPLDGVRDLPDAMGCDYYFSARYAKGSEPLLKNGLSAVSKKSGVVSDVPLEFLLEFCF